MTDANLPKRTSHIVFWRLVVMMFLQYFVQGCYLPIASVYVRDSLGFGPWQFGFFSSALAIGPLFAPFILGQIVDRYFSSQYVLSFCHLAGGFIMLAIYQQGNQLIAISNAGGNDVATSQMIYTWTVIGLATLYSILYIPSMMLTNAIAFHHLQNRDREFPWVRLFGTIGFIVPALVVEQWWLKGVTGADLSAARGIAFAFAGISGIVMGFYSLLLPHTPPKGAKSSYAPGVVISMLRERPFLVLVIATFAIAIVHKFYFAWNSPFLTAILRSGSVEGAYEQQISSIGQIFEVVVMVGLGLFIRKCGFKVVLLTGATAYFVRCLVFASVFQFEMPFATRMSLAVVGQALHGVCFGCFLAAGFMFVDRVCAKDVRGSMQTFYGTFVISLGMFVGGLVAGGVGDMFTAADDTVDWPQLWLAGAAMALVSVIGFAIFFPARGGIAQDSEE